MTTQSPGGEIQPKVTGAEPPHHESFAETALKYLEGLDH